MAIWVITRLYLRLVASRCCCLLPHSLKLQSTTPNSLFSSDEVPGMSSQTIAPGLLLDAACAGLGMALVSQLLSRQALANGSLKPLVEQTIRGPNWALLTHRDSENNPLARSFSEWLVNNLQTPQ